LKEKTTTINTHLNSNDLYNLGATKDETTQNLLGFQQPVDYGDFEERRRGRGGRGGNRGGARPVPGGAQGRGDRKPK